MRIWLRNRIYGKVKEMFSQKVICRRQVSYKVVELEQVQEQLVFVGMVASLVHQLLQTNASYPLMALQRLKGKFTVGNIN